MSIRFSDDGPAFPEELVESLLVGEVVFLCGAGISAPQLPLFGQLVDRCYAELRLDKNPSEEKSYESERYEEVLGSISRRIVSPSEMIDVVSRSLRPVAAPDLSHHKTILRLSRDLQNGPTVVTTNFDTLLEAALCEMVGDDPKTVRASSFAGQDLPPPGAEHFHGLIHLHGRIADPGFGVDETPLVLTSHNYGEAYMRSGWASRFLFDLCRCRTLVLIGYSASDAPVRYFLNVLEADRARFPDLRKVYALDSVEHLGQPDASWGALAVEPLTYLLGEGADRYLPLWRDLGKLADLVERPRSTREAWAKELLSKPTLQASTSEVDRAAWLLGGRQDLWALAIRSINDPAWFGIFHERGLWVKSLAARVVASWIGRDLRSEERFSVALEWRDKLGTEFLGEVRYWLNRENELEDLWYRAWRFFSVGQSSNDYDNYTLSTRLRRDNPLQADIEDAFAAISPKVALSKPVHLIVGSEPAEGLRRLASIDVDVPDRGHLKEIADALVIVPNPLAALGRAASALEAYLHTMVDIGLASDDFDPSDYRVPSVEPHAQNAYRNGPVRLVELISKLLPKSAEKNAEQTGNILLVLREAPGKLGVRIRLNALRQDVLYSTDDAVTELLALPMMSFWRIKREVALVLQERSKDASADLLSKIEGRIRDEAEEYFETFELDGDQVDWRKHARDRDVWMRLSMLEIAGGFPKREPRSLSKSRSEIPT